MQFWMDGQVISGRLSTPALGEVFSGFPFVALPDPQVLQRTLLWWEVRWWNTEYPGVNSVQPPALEFKVVAVEAETGESPPPGPEKPIMRGLMSAPHDAHQSPGGVSFPDVHLRSWMGSSGADPMQSKGRRAAVNYAGGLSLRVAASLVMDPVDVDLFWLNEWVFVYFKLAIEVDDPSS